MNISNRSTLGKLIKDCLKDGGRLVNDILVEMAGDGNRLEYASQLILCITLITYLQVSWQYIRRLLNYYLFRTTRSWDATLTLKDTVLHNVPLHTLVYMH